jgi:hypothetical protein
MLLDLRDIMNWMFSIRGQTTIDLSILLFGHWSVSVSVTYLTFDKSR